MKSSWPCLTRPSPAEDSRVKHANDGLGSPAMTTFAGFRRNDGSACSALQRDQLFGGGRMKRHGAVEIFFGCAHTQQDGEELGHLSGPLAYDMGAKHPAGQPID